MFAYSGPCETKEKALEVLQQPQKFVVCDTETISIKNNTGIGIGLYLEGGHTYYFPVFPDLTEETPYVMGLLGSRDIVKVYFNAMFDIRVLHDLAMFEGLTEPDTHNIEDVSIMAQVSGYVHSLEELSDYLLGESNPLSISELLAEAKESGTRSPTMLDVSLESTAQKCMYDVYYTYKCWVEMEKRLLPRPRDCYEVDRDLSGELLHIERKGLKLNKAMLHVCYEELRRDVLRWESIARDAGFEISKPAQVGYTLAERGNVLPLTKNYRQLKTDSETLEDVDDPLVPMILAYRKSKKLLSTYVVPWMDQDRAYTHFRLDLSTGRLASRDRNLQNIPSSDSKSSHVGASIVQNMRAIFTPDNEVFSWMDYAQIEMRLAAFIAKDDVMMEAYNTGRDVHDITQKEVGLPARVMAKTFNFAMIYDASAKTLAKKTKLSLGRAKEYKNRWLSLYSGIHMYMVTQQNLDVEWVESEFGRRMRLPDPAFFYPDHIDKCKVNYVIQGTAADIIKRAMLKVKDLDLRVQVHDELVVDGRAEFDEALAHIHPEITTPFEAKSGNVWV